MKPLTNKIRQTRQLLGWTQMYVAHELNIPQGRVSEIETATNSDNLAIGTIRPFAKLFKCRIDDLVPEPESAR